MNEQTRRILSELPHIHPGASEEAIKSLQESVTIDLPVSYIQFLRYSNGIEGPIGSKHYLQLWPAKEVVQETIGYGGVKYAPGLLMIGSNGGNVVYGLDLREANPVGGAFVEMDFIGLDWEDVFYRTKTFDAFIQYLIEAELPDT